MTKENKGDQRTVGTKTVGKSFFIHVAIILSFMFGFGLLPTISTITVQGMQVLGIFLACIYAWTVGMLDWPSVLAMVAVSLTGYATLPETVAITFGNQVLWLVMFAMVFCYAIEKTGLLPIIAKRILNIRFTRKGPWALSFVFMIAAAVTGFLTTNALTVIVILWKIFEEMVDELGIDHDHPYVSCVLIMIVIAGTAGSIIAPYTGFVLMSFGFYDSLIGGPSVNAFAYVLVMLFINVVIYIAFILVFKYLLRINVSFEGLRTYEANEVKLNQRQNIMLGLIVLLALCMMLPHLLPDGNVIKTILLVRLGSLGVMIMITLIFAVLTKDGETFLDLAQGFREGIPWSLFLMVGTSLMVAQALANDFTGVTDAFTRSVSPILEGKPLHLLLIILSLLSLVLTNLLNNNACLAIFAPISIVLVQNAGGNPQTIVVLLAFSCMLGYILPASSAMGALLHGHKWLSVKQIYKYGGIMLVIIMIMLVLIGVPLANYIFG